MDGDVMPPLWCGLVAQRIGVDNDQYKACGTWINLAISLAIIVGENILQLS